jgi:transcription termination factor Rho
MSERRRPPRRGRGQRPYNRPASESEANDNPYRDEGAGAGEGEPRDDGREAESREQPTEPIVSESAPPPMPTAEAAPSPAQPYRGPADVGQGAGPGGGAGGGLNADRRNGRRHRRGRGRGPRREQVSAPQQQAPVVATGETRGWFEPTRDGGFVRRASNSYLPEAGDAYVPPNLVRQFSIRRADAIEATTGIDQRGRSTVVEIRAINDVDPNLAGGRPEFNSLPAAYPERKLFMETGRPAKVGPELTRRAIDLIAPIGYGQRALIVAPARAGKTTLLHAITEGVAVNHPNADLLILLVDERPEEVSEAVSWGVGEVISSSFDQPAQRHVDVTEMVLERARRLVESGRDVVIVLDSLTRMARAHNTAERGTGRTLSGGLDATAMAKPKAFFGSARAIPPTAGGGSLTIIATALVETGSRMDDVIFEEFKGTGNSEIKLDRGLAEKRIYPAIDIATSGTRREEKLFRPDQLEGVYTLRRGLSQMPPQSAMEWLIKRIAATVSNDALLAGL